MIFFLHSFSGFIEKRKKKFERAKTWFHDIDCLHNATQHFSLVFWIISFIEFKFEGRTFRFYVKLFSSSWWWLVHQRWMRLKGNKSFIYHHSSVFLTSSESQQTQALFSWRQPVANQISESNFEIEQHEEFTSYLFHEEIWILMRIKFEVSISFWRRWELAEFGNEYEFSIII